MLLRATTESSTRLVSSSIPQSTNTSFFSLCGSSWKTASAHASPTWRCHGLPFTNWHDHSTATFEPGRHPITDFMGVVQPTVMQPRPWSRNAANGWNALLPNEKSLNSCFRGVTSCPAVPTKQADTLYIYIDAIPTRNRPKPDTSEYSRLGKLEGREYERVGSPSPLTFCRFRAKMASCSASVTTELT